MPLFMCSRCGCVDNTATSKFWEQQMTAVELGIEHKPLCAECSPQVRRWHGHFPRKLAEGFVADQRGFIYTPEQAAGSASHMGPFTPVVLPDGARV
jgi:hypothetical protein